MIKEVVGEEKRGYLYLAERLKGRSETGLGTLKVISIWKASQKDAFIFCDFTFLRGKKGEMIWQFLLLT